MIEGCPLRWGLFGKFHLHHSQTQACMVPMLPLLPPLWFYNIMVRRVTISFLFLPIALQSQTQSPVIRVNTRLVQVNVIVHDKNGPVSDLHKDDFVLLDRGKERPIEFFSIDKRMPGQTAAK